jgi:putative chitinase
MQDILRKLAPRTPAPKRDRFVPFLEEACPRYQINTELRLAAFLATICFESAYFRTTVEYRATKGRAKTLQDRYWSQGFYGRGLIQLTHKANYEAFDNAIQAPVNFVLRPELVAEPRWAVESACWYWHEHDLNKYADKGQFFQIQGLVNRGSATKRALDYDTRLKLYDLALQAIPTISPASLKPATSAATVDPPIASATANEAQTTTPAGEPLFDKATNWLSDKRTKIQKLGVDPTEVSVGSRVVFVLKYVWAGILAVGSYFWDRPWLLLGSVALIIAAGWYLSASKDRFVKKKLIEG